MVCLFCQYSANPVIVLSILSIFCPLCQWFVYFVNTLSIQSMLCPFCQYSGNPVNVLSNCQYSVNLINNLILIISTRKFYVRNYPKPEKLLPENGFLSVIEILIAVNILSILAISWPKSVKRPISGTNTKYFNFDSGIDKSKRFWIIFSFIKFFARLHF